VVSHRIGSLNLEQVDDVISTTTVDIFPRSPSLDMGCGRVHVEGKMGMGLASDMGHSGGAIWKPIRVGTVFINNFILFIY